MRQPRTKGHQPTAIQQFRRDLRVLEREILRQLEGETGCCGVSLPQCHVLLELSFADLSLGTLAAALNLDKSTLSRTVEAMVQTGLVTRASAPADRRQVRLTLSARGQAKVATINGTCDRYYASLLGQMGEADQRKVTRAVRLLADGMRQLRGSTPLAALCCGPTPVANARGGAQCETPAARGGRTARKERET